MNAMKCTAFVILFGMAAQAQAANSQEQAVRRVVADCVRSWDQADAAGIADAFEPDGDFVNPGGFHAKGRKGVAAFYSRAFAAGYAQSRGDFLVRDVRFVGGTLAIVDAEWSITHAHTRGGADLPPERGLATALLQKHSSGWKIVALREQSSGTELHQ